VADEAPVPSARQLELLEAAYRYTLEHGLTDLSLRPLATAIGTSPRVLMFLFGNKNGLVRALLARARADELATLEHLRHVGQGTPPGLGPAVEEVWAWLATAEHRPLLRLWAEGYARSLVDPDGAWGGFAHATVHDWLGVLASCQPDSERHTKQGEALRTLALAVLRGALLDLLATGDADRVARALDIHLTQLRSRERDPTRRTRDDPRQTRGHGRDDHG
jgi:AcrR family transcriptional regulator